MDKSERTLREIYLKPFKRAVDACLAASQKLSETKITDLNEAKKFCENQIKNIK